MVTPATDLSACVPKDKHDHDAVAAAKAAGFPALNPILPELLEWLQDINWPVAQGLLPVLAGAGPEIAAPIRHVLVGKDGLWKFFVITWLVEKLDPDVQVLLVDDLTRLATTPTDDDMREEADQAAREVLGEMQGA